MNLPRRDDAAALLRYENGEPMKALPVGPRDAALLVVQAFYAESVVRAFAIPRRWVETRRLIAK